MKKLLFILLLLIVHGSFASIAPYFNHNPDSSYHEPYRKITRSGDNLEAVMVNAVRRAQRRLWIAVQEINLPILAQEIAKKHREGVDVRLIIENNYNRTFTELPAEVIATFNEHQRTKYLNHFTLIDSSGDGLISNWELNNNDALRILAAVPRIDDTSDGSKGSGLMHHKFMIIDNDSMILSSANFTMSGVHGDKIDPRTRGNANALLDVRNRGDLVSVFEREFLLMWNERKFGVRKDYRGVQNLSRSQTPIQVKFSPTSSRIAFKYSTNGFLSGHLSQARSHVAMNLFVFSDQQIANALQYAHSRGAVVEPLIDLSFATRYYSELLDLWGLTMPSTRNCQIEEGNRPWRYPIQRGGAPIMANGDKFHHKFAVIDGETLLFGSHNWSATANRMNDEYVVAIKDRRLAQAFLRQHAYWMNGRSVLQPPAALLEKIRMIKEKCEELGL